LFPFRFDTGGVQPLVIKAGDSKNPLTTFGSVTKQDLEHQKDQLEKVHAAFKQLVLQGRPSLKDRLDQVANGNVFLGDEALDLELVDRVATSSQYLLERVQAGDRVLKLHRSSPSRFPRRVGSLSPLDILPHLRSRLERLVQAVRSQVEQHADFSSWIVQGATYLSLLHHLFTQYRRPR
jgi:serine protease SohB